MLKSFLISLMLFCTVSFAFGQDVFKGRIFENKTRVSLADIQIKNITNKLNTTSDDKGRFTIRAKMGDILVFQGFAYMPDTLLLIDMHERDVFLAPHQNFLDEVKVITDSTKNFSTFYDPEFHGQPAVYTRDGNLNFTGGITVRLWWWKRDERKREKLEKELQDQKEEDKIAKIFIPAIISKYVPLKGKDMDDFLTLYTPEPKVYDRYDFNMTSYLNDCYGKYLKLPDDKRHPQKLED